MEYPHSHFLPCVSSDVDVICEGDSYVIRNVLGEQLSALCRNIDLLESEINFVDMLHGGSPVARKVALQGDIDADGDFPLYRTPADFMLEVLPWSQTVFEIKSNLQERLGMTFNHVKMQLYRDGSDYITKHSDKTLDIKMGSTIVNLNVGTTRTFTLQNKTTRENLHIPFHHNTAILIGWDTNKRWWHSVKKDPAVHDKRISMVFRDIATFVTVLPEEGTKRVLYGQGATCKEKHTAILRAVDRAYIDRNTPISEEVTGTFDQKSFPNQQQSVHADVIQETHLLQQAFSHENREVDFDWSVWYGRGFDVLDFRSCLQAPHGDIGLSAEAPDNGAVP